MVDDKQRIIEMIQLVRKREDVNIENLNPLDSFHIGQIRAALENYWNSNPGIQNLPHTDREYITKCMLDFIEKMQEKNILLVGIIFSIHLNKSFKEQN